MIDQDNADEILLLRRAGKRLLTEQLAVEAVA